MTRRRTTDIWQHFGRLTQLLQAQFSVATGSPDPLTRGQVRESFVKHVLEPHLPGKVVVAAGEIIDSLHYVSRPVDLVLYRDDVPRFDLGGGASQFLVEGVLATVEVKSNLTGPELGRALEQVRSVKRATPIHRLPEIVEYHRERGDLDRLQRLEPSVRATVFAYDGMQLGEVLGALGKLKDLSVTPDCLCILNSGTIQRLMGPEPEDIRYGVVSYAPNSLMAFFFYLLECVTRQLPGYDWSSYARAPN